ncbi:MAG: glycosyltransferase [Cyanobacteria bacterium P01_A01_bin.45]
MIHFGIICPAVSGHLNPMIGLCYELKQRGHRITFISLLDAQSKIEAAGLEFQAIGKSEFPLGFIVESLAKLGHLSGQAALKYALSLFQQVAKTTLREAPKVIQELDIEALLVDQTSTSGGTIAEFLEIPFIIICNALVLNRDIIVPPFYTTWKYHPSLWAKLRNQLGYQLLDFIGKPIIKTINQCRQEWNLSPIYKAHNYCSKLKLAELSQQPSEFEFPRQNLPSYFHFTGPYYNPKTRQPVSFPFQKLDGRPLIYASMGTIQNCLLGVFKSIAKACSDLDNQLVISLGGSANSESLGRLPGNTIVVDYAPQLEILQKTTLTITHAGLNTTLESLGNGVPMVAIPIANDQLGVASRISWTGTGEFIPLKKISVPVLKEYIEKVFTEYSYKENALKLQTAIQQSGGASQGADIIEEAISNGKPVLSKIN